MKTSVSFLRNISSAVFFKAIYFKLFKINDNPQKIAMGVGLGVFLGIMPGTGPIAALFLAILFKVNKASALLGSVITNIWLSIPLFLLSAKIGSLVTGLKYSDIYVAWSNFLKDFHWMELFHESVYKIILPVLAGYAIVSLCAGAFAYLFTLIILKSFTPKKITTS